MDPRVHELSRTLSALARGRILIRPYAAAGSRREPLIAGLCIIVIVAVYLLELVTPDDYVVIDLALLPLLGAMWVLSPRMAAVVVIVASAVFIHEAVIDSANRTTVIILGVTMLVTTVVARLHANTLAMILADRRNARTNVPKGNLGATLEAVDRSTHGFRSLTKRELEVIRLAADGYTAREIGGRLSIGTRTVETHLAGAYSKLRINSRAELMRLAVRLSSPSLSAGE
jgi:DNA-binding CsgD family transcriptional regulator